MKTAIFTLLFFVSSGFAWAQTSIEIDAFGNKIKFTKPDEKVWNLVKETAPNEGEKGVLVFKHEKIMGKKGAPSEPVISLIYEQVPKSMNAAAYAMKGLEDIEKSLKIIWELLGGYPDYSSDQHSVVIIADSTDDVFKQVDEDMSVFIKSVVIQP
jgi:hypothetical protein